MAINNSENKSGNGIGASVPSKGPRIEKLKALLETVTANRLALKTDRKAFLVEEFAKRLMKALVEKDRVTIASIIDQSKKAGFLEDDLKAAVRKIRK